MTTLQKELGLTDAELKAVVDDIFKRKENDEKDK